MTIEFESERKAPGPATCAPGEFVLAAAARLLTLILLAWVLGGAVPAAAEDTGSKPPEELSIDFDNVDIKVFVKFISKITGKNFILDQRVKGRVTVISPTKISAADAYRVFESVLRPMLYHGDFGPGHQNRPLPSARADNIDTRLVSGTGGASRRPPGDKD